jgi:hypothetical protein
MRFVTGRLRIASVSIAVLALALLGVCKAADISHMPIGDEAAGFIIIAGELNQGDETKFNLTAQRYTKGAVLLASPGGNLVAGIEIGRIIRLRNFVTGVAPRTRCASACALAWLGGTQRFMSSTSLIGFHTASVVDRGKTTESGLGNAIVGAYLTTLGLPLSAVIYIAKSPPDDITWLNVHDAKRVGIDVSLLDLSPQSSSKDPQPLPSNEQSEQAKEDAPILQKVPQLRPSERWVVVASRGDLNEAISIARDYKQTFPETRVFRSENGQYGVTIGQFDIDQNPGLIIELVQSSRIPKDSYSTPGKRFVGIAWQ